MEMEQRELERLITENEPFILRCAGEAAHRYVTKSDDEWSVALAAFAEAVREYRPERGALQPFAALVIRRRLADHFRVCARRAPEILTAPEVFEGGPVEDSPQPALQRALCDRLAVSPQEDALSMEIEAAEAEFSRFGFTFFDLAACSPKAEKTKAACAKAAAYLLRRPLLLCEMRQSGQLPLKLLEENCRIPRKILERHRKYLIAAVVILSGEYPGLAAYLRLIRKELEK